MSKKKIFIAFILNLIFSMFELVGGILSGSVSILSDSIHDLGDALSIGISYFLERKSEQHPDKKYTYGYNRFSSLGAFVVNSVLALGSIGMIVASVSRLFNPIEVKSTLMIIFAVVGVIINFFAMIVTSKGETLNQKAVNIHMLEDVLGWAVVLIGAVFVKLTGNCYIDPVLSIAVSLFILCHAVKGMRQVLNLFLLKVPKNVDIDKLKKKIEKIKEVQNVHHLHIWSMDGKNHFATMHIVCDKNICEVKQKIRETLLDMHIVHATIEVESKKDVCDDIECKGVHSCHHSHCHCHHH